ncbi:MAG: tyrosine-protein phosphatase [Dysgonamonadaceae bacterium]|jgi:protein-tyrosine phosphatase|nr:tyrosine-protein phosphatase [Dysgonamonadaceae bacterium]
MLYRLLVIIVVMLPIVACQKGRPDIRVACDTDIVTGCTRIKWEIFPAQKGKVKIYESTRADSFNLYSPIRETDIDGGFQDIFSLRSTGRTYYLLVFNNKYPIVTAERIISLEGPFNFRDLGGYYTESNRQVKWGKLFRSSSLTMLTRRDVKTLKRLNINTIIDLRTEAEQYKYPYRYRAKQVFSVPLLGNPNGPRFWLDKILSGQIGKEDVTSYLSVVNTFFLENNSQYFKQVFDILVDDKNYPVIFNCMHGNDRTGVVSALVLFALGVDWNQTLDDWLMSDKLMDYYSIGIGNPEMYPEIVLETMTAMFREPRETFAGPFGKIASDYGSIDKFLETECGLTPEKKAKLRSLLLYP